MRAGCSLALIGALLSGAPARAQNPQAAATIQFDQGRALMKQRAYKEACAAFEQSQQLDPQNGTLFNLAECNAHLGKLATAWLAYRDLGQRDTNPGRRQESNRRAKELEHRLAKLVVRIEPRPPGLSVTINGREATALVGVDSPIDLGDYTVRATAPGFAPVEATAAVTVEGKTVKLSLALDRRAGRGEPPTGAAAATPDPEPAREAGGEPPPTDDEPAAPASHRRRNGAIIAGAGGGLLVVGAVFGLRARSAWNDAQSVCPGQVCATAADRQRGDALVDTARGDATWSTALVVGGAAAVAIGAYLIATAPSARATTALRLAPTADGAVVVLGGRF